ncbi:YDG/SRA domain-containing protein [Arthrobacter sp. FW305-BF8]|uniref:YDG/SRA domain-containing protein n=1 Tax=Arthrobacter sp. FW305-BF8 TaxID=2879617 RepID=UPI003FA4196C|nr:YDG/SRA domain-containing protein [Arthrobacter sp. FW305-BF8]
MTDYGLGHVASVPVGSVFHSRKEVKDAGLHRHTVNGIDGDEHLTRAIVAAGVYSGDRDHGITLSYSGQGGFDRDTGVQVDHQRFEGANAGLAASSVSGMAIRLIRGWGPKKGAKVYRYDGLFRVSRYWLDQTGKFDVCMYQLDAVDSDLGYVFEPDLDHKGHPFPVNPRNSGTLPMLTYDRATQVTNERLVSLERALWHCEQCSAAQDIGKGELLRAVPGGGGGLGVFAADQQTVLCTSCFRAYLRKSPQARAW